MVPIDRPRWDLSNGTIFVTYWPLVGKSWAHKVGHFGSGIGSRFGSGGGRGVIHPFFVHGRSLDQVLVMIHVVMMDHPCLIMPSRFPLLPGVGYLWCTISLFSESLPGNLNTINYEKEDPDLFISPFHSRAPPSCSDLPRSPPYPKNQYLSPLSQKLLPCLFGWWKKR